jgi:hypothetical protein
MKNRESGNDKGRVKFRIIEFEVDGGNATIQEGLRSVAAALTRTTAPSPKPALLVAGETRPKPTSAPQGEQLGLGIQMDEEAETAPDADEVIEDAKPRPQRRAPVPNVLNGLDLDGDPSLAEFIKKKNVTGQAMTYLVAAVWLNEHKNIREFTADHAFTVYKRLGLTPPKDAGEPLRKLRKMRLLDKGEKEGAYIVNDASKDQVARMAASAA